MTTDERRLAHLIEVWHDAGRDVVALLRDLREDEWDLPTDLPGWDVRAVAAHLAHLESELAGYPQAEVEVPDAPHVKNQVGRFTERGPLARRGWPPAAVIDELERSIEARYAVLAADPPTDASATGPGFAGHLGWSWGTLLSNRPFDLWMHEQDVRRATGRPGGLDTPGAAHAVGVLTASVAYMLAKRAQAGPGRSLVVEVTGPTARTVGAVVDAEGRGNLVIDLPADPDVRLRMDTETFVVLAGGRRTAEELEVDVTGDPDLAARVLGAMAVTR